MARPITTVAGLARRIMALSELEKEHLIADIAKIFYMDPEKEGRIDLEKQFTGDTVEHVQALVDTALGLRPGSAN